MSNIYYDVRVDIQKDIVIDSGLRFTQGDSKVIYLRITVMNGGVEFDASNTTPSVNFVKPDGTYVTGTPVKSGNFWIYQILGNELQKAGKVLCDIKFTYESGRISSSKFTFIVEKDTTISNAEASSSYILPMEELLIEMQNYKNQGVSIVEASAINATEAKQGATDAKNEADRAKDEADRVNNNIRRTRRNITSDLANLPTAIAEQNLEKYGYAIGDYFVGASGYYYYLADMNTYYGGYNNHAIVNTKHCGIVVDTKSTCRWISEGTVTNYSSSTLHSFLTNTALLNIKSDIATLFGDWESHLLKRTELDNAIGGCGTTWDGLKDCLICAMTEVQMYGTRVFGADGNQTGTGSKALELFRKYRFNEIYGNTAVWLKSLFSASLACGADAYGNASNLSVSYSLRASGLILFH